MKYKVSEANPLVEMYKSCINASVASRKSSFYPSQPWCMSCVQCARVCLCVCLCMSESWWRGCSWGRHSGTMTEWGRPAAEWHAHNVSLSFTNTHTHFTISLNKSAWIMVLPLAVKHCPILKHTHKHRRESVYGYTKQWYGYAVQAESQLRKSLWVFLASFVSKVYALFEEFNLY